MAPTVQRRWTTHADGGVQAAQYADMPLTGLMDFTADGTGTFEVRHQPRVDSRFVPERRRRRRCHRSRGARHGMTMELEASPRLAVPNGSNRADREEHADVTLRFTDTSPIPTRALQPSRRRSPRGGSGTLHISGGLAKLNAERGCRVRAGAIEAVGSALRTAPIQVVMNQVSSKWMTSIHRDGTELSVTALRSDAKRISGIARGSANLGLRAFIAHPTSGRRSCWRRSALARRAGPLGQATIADGRLLRRRRIP
jgi:hypothetical protein